MLCASLVASAGNRASAVSRITCRTRASAAGEIARRLTITTSAQDGSAASARTTAAPTCPLPPAIKTRNAILSPPSRLRLSHAAAQPCQESPVGRDDRHRVLILPRRRDERLLGGHKGLKNRIALVHSGPRWRRHLGPILSCRCTHDHPGNHHR